MRDSESDKVIEAGDDRTNLITMRVSFKKVAIIVLTLYFLVTCYTGYMVIRKQFEKSYKDYQANNIVKVTRDDLDWNPWGQEFEKEHQKVPSFERPRLVLEPGQENGTTGPSVMPVKKPKVTSHVVEIWGKAAIGIYLWEHIMGGILEEQLGGIWSYGLQYEGNIQFRFRTGAGVIPDKVPQDTRHVVLVLNGREPTKVNAAIIWLDYLSKLPRLVNAAVVLLGNEQCDNQWIHKYMAMHGGLVKVVFLVYDSPEVDDENFFQWPLGVATYRHFPLVLLEDVSAGSQRPYLCNFLGTVYVNSSRAALIPTLHRAPYGASCYIRQRVQWSPNETPDSRETYIQALTNSDLTLNPVGRNTECYRIYEALSLGSVPVVEDVMTPGGCGGPDRTPLRLLKQHEAPVIYVRNWTIIGQLLERENQRPLREVVKRRYEVLHWYTDFLAKMKHTFVAVLRRKFFAEVVR